ncbi:MAG: heme-copper oxidase subunit III [Terriglobia bacterium]
MAGRTATEELELTQVGGNGDGEAGDRGPDGNGGGEASPAAPAGIYVTGVWLALASILMFFTALASSFVVRKGLSNDWVAFPLPGILWANTAVLVVSSATLERARRRLARQALNDFRAWWGLSTALGLLFLVGQLVAWRELRAAGVYVSTNPSSSFFYLLTGTHGLHLLGGVLALLYVGVRERRDALRVSRETAVAATSIYWHFLGGLWIALFLLLYLG